MEAPSTCLGTPARYRPLGSAAAFATARRGSLAVVSTRQDVLTTYYLLLTTYYLLLTAYYLILTAYYLLLPRTTYYLVLTAHY